jgi:maleylpyruvate isomerase
MTDHPATETPEQRSEAFSASLHQLDQATATLLEVSDRMRPDEQSQPTTLPGWTLGHLLTHLARNADAVRNLAVWASSGVETPMYPSGQARDEAIEAGADRSRGELLDDLRSTANDLRVELGSMPPSALTATVRLRSGRPLSGRSLPYFRTQEVYIHLIDLGLGYGPTDWPDDFVLTALGRISRGRAKADRLPASAVRSSVDGSEWVCGSADGPTIVGQPARLLEWLVGRGDMASLSTVSGEAVPSPIDW